MNEQQHAYPGYQPTADYLEAARRTGEMFTPGYCQILLETLDGYAHEALTFRDLLNKLVLVDAGDKQSIQTLQQRAKLVLGQG